MEVVSIFTSEKELVNLLYKFANSYNKLSLSSMDDEDVYFVNIENGENEIFIHHELLDIEHEFSYNYSEEEAKYVKNYFKELPIFLFDISFRNIAFLNALLQEFIFFLKNNKEVTINKILLSDPFEGLKPIL